ncbi:CCA tRNA nucleotidyltransferase [Campylobacter hepaticus]|uniref:CCA tRNA nucleotidyltransferase n=1 Tax=Campylobacter hepaticus TaxID=1813019 RepID=A0A424Z2K6_9BACT|nr:CCA tRNA nucleotidyltransferase [Campylobacter hepaticus]AXP08656.1 CCA tRNA nucleotidyltransferase [Campylobacter hepaticus]MCZ0772499.1 CCA tRNA nucleotidyltransferase [Campylobacter hepaticus]MCZ0773967.1 CCA tRNA nucleotidyltransferase [Campylobacter hepaticus]MCZ0775219.1 CCA tRNA nucleotidyltransferase [Campylobacter hepaticus]MDX2323280.1 CCA tRNA nucleotidyltransferase [Campylobacter hepaticus]
MQTLKINLKNNPDLKFIADFLKSYTTRAYLVGGSVRDLFLGLKLYDYDIEIYDIKPSDFEKIMQKLGAQGFGKSFFVYKFKNYDLALARTENKIAYGHTGFKVDICNDEKIGAKRRDFTINSMMINLFNNDFLDFYGGLKDLKNGLLRHIDDQSFQEDSLRILRAVVFASKFNFKITQESFNLMQNMSIKDLSKDRINEQLYKFFKSPRLDIGYKYFQDLGLEKEIFGFENSFCTVKFQNLLKKSRQFVQDETLFLYLYLNYFQLNKEEFFKRTKLKKKYLKKINQAFYFDDISDFELAKIALEIPLKDWLGLWDKKRIMQAKRLKLYEDKFQSKIRAKDFIDSGICGKILGLELKKAKENELQIYIQRLNS